MHKYHLSYPCVGKNWRGKVAAMLLVVLLASCARDDGFRPGDFSSDWIDISSGTVFGKFTRTGGHLEFIWTIHNKTDEPLWVEATFLAPPFNPACVVTKKITNVEKEFFVCEQKTMTADTDYPVGLRIYRDELLSQLAEVTESKLRFRHAGVEDLLYWMTPPTLPVAFEGVSYSEKLGLATTLLLLHAFDNGTLHIDENGVRYKNRDQNINIPSSQIRNVEALDLRDAYWVIVQYYMGGKDRRIGFKTQSFVRSRLVNRDIHKAIMYVYILSHEEQ